MPAAILKKQFESQLGGLLDWQSRPAPDTVPTGIAEVDGAIGGLPRGSLTEIFGPASSGRTSLLISILAAATARQESCALVDAADAFDPASAEAAGVLLDRVLWIRCGHNAEHALKAVDLLIQGGGFGLVAMDLGDTPPAIARRISMVSWFRLRRAVEYTPTVLVTLARQSNAKTCASSRGANLRFSEATIAAACSAAVLRSGKGVSRQKYTALRGPVVCESTLKPAMPLP